MSIDAIAGKARDKRLRRRILQVADAAKAGRGGLGIRGRMLADVLDSQEERPESDEQLMALAQDLINAGLLSMLDLRKRHSDRWGLDTVSYAISEKGTALLLELAPVNALVEDERL
jgi:hypothetical protein